MSLDRSADNTDPHSLAPSTQVYKGYASPDCKSGTFRVITLFNHNNASKGALWIY